MENTTTDQAVPAAVWAVLEIFGHRRHTGLLSEVERFGIRMVRIDVPIGDAFETHEYAPSAVFSLSYCTEEFARADNEWRRPRPVSLIEDKSGLDGFVLEEDAEFQPDDFAEVDEPAPATAADEEVA